MRISDWSSDVCSSDLLCAAYLNSYESEVRQRPFIAVQAKLNKSNETTKNYTLDYSGEPGTSYPANVCGSYTINTSEINNRLQALKEQDGVFGTSRSEERRVGKGCVSTGRSRWSQ